MIFDRHEIQPALSYVNSVLCLMRIERVFARNLRYIHADNGLATVKMSAKTVLDPFYPTFPYGNLCK